MNIKKTTAVLVGMSTVVLALAIVLFVTTFYQVSQASDAALSEPISYQYIMKEHEGKIGVFAPGESEPGRVLEVDISMLPEFDRLALQQGIEIRSESDLKKLIEDFDS